MIRAAGLREPLYGHRIGPYIVDAYFVDSKLAVELDSRGYHLTPRAFENDKKKDAFLQRWGPVLRITSKRMRDEPDAVLNDVITLSSMPPRA